MPGDAWWEEEGRFFPAQTVQDEAATQDAVTSSKKDESNATSNSDQETEDEVVFAGDEVRVCKVQAKSGTSTLLFDPREIDFIESVNRQNYVSVRGELYQTPSTLDELERELARFGFFRCHRSYIVNVQCIAKVERFTRNSFNLTLLCLFLGNPYSLYWRYYGSHENHIRYFALGITHWRRTRTN